MLRSLPRASIRTLHDTLHAHTAVKRGARAQFPPKLSLNSLKLSKIFALKPKVKTVAEKLSFKLHI